MNEGEVSRAFRTAYEQADACTVFWCPTIFGRLRDRQDGCLLRILGPEVGSEAAETATLIDAANGELAAYFKAFDDDELLRQREPFLRLFAKPIERTARAAARRRHGETDGGSTNLLDFAPSDRYRETVGGMGRPHACRPSVGFYVKIAQPFGAADPDETLLDVSAAAVTVLELEMNLEFQIEATYKPPKPFVDFWPIGQAFLKACKQDALLVDLGPGGSWLLRADEQPKQFPGQNEWRVLPGRETNLGALYGFIAHRLRRHVRPSVAQRWTQRAQGQQEAFGATLSGGVVHGGPLTVRIDGFAYWLFEAFFPASVDRPRTPGVDLEDEREPPDPILLSLVGRDVHFAMYEPEPRAAIRCLCGASYPTHDDRVPNVVSFRTPATAWIFKQYDDGRSCGLDWPTLSSPRTYLSADPDAIWGGRKNDPRRKQHIADADRAWLRALATAFDGA